jgi:hypothetical protein
VSARTQELAQALRALARDPSRRWRALAVACAAVVGAKALQVVVGPFFDDLAMHGFHDWDAHSAYRYITPLSLLRYHEWPFWHPWFCGGYPAWEYSEGATNLVNPFLPAYLALPVQVAMRVEVAGTAVVGLVSTYLLAGRFTRVVALRALCAVAYAINGRWALQIGVGHMWHLHYAWLPLVVWLYLRAQEPGRARYALYAGMVVALLLYMGGIYPLPHTVLSLFVFMIVATVTERSARPVWTLAIVGFSSLGFSAPKLLPLAAHMSHHPRTIESPESLDLRQIVAMMTDPMQSYNRPATAVGPWGWHEFGIYIGLPAFVAIAAGMLFAGGRLAMAPKVAGVVFFALGLGSFHPNAPWSLLHKVPPFSSQHVPSRFLQPAVLFLSIAFAVLATRWLDKRLRAHPWLELLLVVPLYFVAVDIAEVGRKTTEHVFFQAAPADLKPARDFHHVQQQIYNYEPPDWGGANLLSMYANTGRIECYGVPVPPEQRGALAKTNPAYKGEAYVVNAPGNAVVTQWSPNRAVVEYANAGEGALVVYNMNWDPNWTANGERAWNHANAVAIPVKAGSGRVMFRYFPRAMAPGLGLFALTVALALLGPRLAGRAMSISRNLRKRPADKEA